MLQTSKIVRFSNNVDRCIKGSISIKNNLRRGRVYPTSQASLDSHLFYLFFVFENLSIIW